MDSNELKAKADKAEVDIEAATGIKGSEGNWFSKHPGVLIAGALALLMAMAFLHSCVGVI